MGNTAGKWNRFGSIYTPKIAERLPGMFSDGQDLVEVLDELGVPETTFRKWLKEYPELKEAYELGKQRSKRWWMKLGREGAEGGMINGQVWTFHMKNRYHWADKVEQTISSPEGGAVIQQIVLQGVSALEAPARKPLEIPHESSDDTDS